MKTKELRDVFDRLADLQTKRQLGREGHVLKSAFGLLLKSVYSMVRGQAPPRIMRGLMDLETDIGGEDGDFNTFSQRQMIDLFKRGKVFELLVTSLDVQPLLTSAVDLDGVGRWLESTDGGSTRTSLTAARFVHCWMRLFAEETGLVEFDQPVEPCGPVSANPPGNDQDALPQPGKPFVDSITGMTFVFVPGGTFSMGDIFGDGAQDEQPVHEVSLSPFFMAIHPVTQAQWEKLMGDNPSNTVGDHHPVEQVTLGDVMAFIARLNDASPEGVRFDLPTEAQWEYAARSGGLDEPYAGGQDPEAVAWFDNQADGGTAPVGTKSANGLGLYDMSGNVWEWCRDVYLASAYRQHAKLDPVCTTGGRDRVIRGGSWHLDAWSARCSRRLSFDPELFGPALGFRLVMVVT